MQNFYLFCKIKHNYLDLYTNLKIESLKSTVRSLKIRQTWPSKLNVTQVSDYRPVAVKM